MSIRVALVLLALLVVGDVLVLAAAAWIVTTVAKAALG